MAPECHSLYYNDLNRLKLLLERGLSMDKVLENFPEFFNRLATTGWICFILDPCLNNEQWVRKFYKNLSTVSLSNPVMKIQGKDVHFGIERVNKVYMLPDLDKADFQVKGCEPRTWMDCILYPGKEVSQAATKRGISMYDFTIEARNWLNIICSRVSPCTHMTSVTNL